MSLEQAVAENTAAIKELTAALLAAGTLQTAQASAAAHSSPAVKAVTRAQKEADAKKSDTPPAADASNAAGEQSASTGASSSPALTSLHDWHEKTAELYAELAEATPSLENLRKAVLGINSKIGRPQADAVLARFGAQAITAKDNKKGLLEEQYPAVFKLSLDVLAGRVDATASMASE